MKRKPDGPCLSFEFADGQAAMRLAQQIANACGGRVTVFDEGGDNVGHAKPQPVGRNGSATIASLQKLANAMEAQVRKALEKGDNDGTQD